VSKRFNHIFLRLLCLLLFTGTYSLVSAQSIILNKYTEVISFEICTNQLAVNNANEFNVGDTVLIIQMKGSVIDSSNTSAFGNITNLNNTGNYEFNYIKSKTGNVLVLKNVLKKEYDLPYGKVQLIRVPYFQDYTLVNTLTCLPWNGSVGGVAAFNVQNTLTLNADIDVSSKGFKGGAIIFNEDYLCDVDSFYLLNNNGVNGGNKGEGVYHTDRLFRGRGKLANGGGGGNSTNSGGAGGGNIGTGGEGGKQYVGVCNNNFTNGGVGGAGFIYSNTDNRIFLGGGGGAGHQNNFAMAPGGNGGGIVIVNAGNIVPNNHSIKAEGESPVHVDALIDDGRSGGGAGGVIVLNYGTVAGNLSLSAAGGKGDDNLSPNYQYFHGPGGGGGGGAVWVNKPLIENNLSVNVAGGMSGSNIALSNTWGATNGFTGAALTGLVLPVDDVPFRPNIDSVRIRAVPASCSAFDFEGGGYVHTYPVATWQWQLGDGTAATTQNVSHHPYTSFGDFEVKLIVTDINGCMDSISTTVHAEPVTVVASEDSTICRNTSVQLSATVTNATQIEWSSGATLNDATIANPVATPAGETLYYVTVSNGDCIAKDSVKIDFHTASSFAISGPVMICKGDSAQLSASGADTYSWTPVNGLTNLTSNNQMVSPATTTDYVVTMTEAVCHEQAILTTTVTIAPQLDSLRIRALSTGCAIFNFEGVSYPQAIQLSTWQWDFGDNIHTNTQNPTHNYAGPGDYPVKLVVTDINGCLDSIDTDIHAEPLTVAASNDLVICRNSSAQLTARSNFATQYRWSPPQTLNDSTIADPVASPHNETVYYVKATNGSCIAMDSVKITFKPAPVFTINAPAKICPGDSVQLNATGGVSYNWTPAPGIQNTAVNNPFVTPARTTQYSVTITEPVCNEQTTLSTSVTVLLLPDVQAFSSNDIDCSHNSSQLRVTGARYYNWTPAAALSNAAISNPVATPTAETKYIVKGTDASGCVNYDSVIVKVGAMNESQYLVPNAFTPNGDGLNDCFGISQWGLVLDVEFSIFNRAGQLLFRTNDPNRCWDGKYKGVLQPAEVYVYMVNGSTKCESSVFRKGTFVLIR
jgi:gliding motility-associated-like protein